MHISAKGTNIAAALILSVLAHFFFMTFVTVVAPEDFFKTEPFTRVTFLGPILEKTAFDIMVAGEGGVSGGREALVPEGFLNPDLHQALSEKDDAIPARYISVGTEVLRRVDKYLVPEKLAPRFYSRGQYSGTAPEGQSGPERLADQYGGRKVLFRPPTPLVAVDGIAVKKYFTVKLSAAVTVSGDVIDVSVARTSGYLFADSEAMKYLRAWKFQSVNDPAGEMPLEIDIPVYCFSGGGVYDKT